MNADADAPPEFDLSCPAARTLLLGQLSRDEQAAIAVMLPSSRLWRRAENLLQAQVLLSEFRIDRILLAQARPGQLPLDTPEQLHAWAPAAELLAVAGDWCEGELRTGQPWEGVPRLYWWQLAPAAVGSPPDGAAPLVLVNAASYDAGSMWTDTLRGLGYPSLWTRRGRREPLHFGERLAIWDGDQLDGQEADLLAAFCRRRRRAQAPVIAVFDYPRADVVATANRVGVTAVLGRPWSWEALELALTRAIQQESPASRPERVTPRLAA